MSATKHVLTTQGHMHGVKTDCGYLDTVEFFPAQLLKWAPLVYLTSKVRLYSENSEDRHEDLYRLSNDVWDLIR